MLIRQYINRKAIRLFVLMSLLIGGPSICGAESNELDQAYKKEFAFLEAQKHDLKSRLATFGFDSTQHESTLTTSLRALEQRTLDLETDNEDLTEQLIRLERSIEVNASNASNLESMFEQAKLTLAGHDKQLENTVAFEKGTEVDKLNIVFDSAVKTESVLASIFNAQGKFFLTNGSEVNGTIIRFGNIAAFGVSDSGSGILVPAGGGRFKLWGDGSTDFGLVAETMLRGESIAALPLFLYESLNKNFEETIEKTVLDIIGDGGVIGWVIVLLGVFAAILIILRSLFLRQADAATGELLHLIGSLVSVGKRKEALELCKKSKGATARVLSDTLRNLDRDRDHLEDIISESILHESTTLNRFGSFIIVIAAVAPLLGLLGTVTGMIATFDVITAFGNGDPKLLSGGISIALVTTELGLIIAIPTLMCGNLLNGWSNSIKDDLEKGALHITNISQAPNINLPDLDAAA